MKTHGAGIWQIWNRGDNYNKYYEITHMQTNKEEEIYNERVIKESPK